MMPIHEQAAQAYLHDLHAKHGWPGGVQDDDVDRLVDLLRQAAAMESQACAEIAEGVMRLCGSHAAEQIANLIRTREPRRP